MGPIKILIIEDEILIAKSIAALVSDLGYQVSGFAHTVQDAHVLINKNNFDIVLLDINLDKGDEGIDLAHKLNEIEKPFIFLTSYHDKKTLDKAKEVKPAAYVVKPADRIDLYTNLEIVVSREIQNKKPQEKKIKLSDGHLTVFIDPKEIKWIKSDRNYLEIKLPQRTLLQRTTFNDFFKLINYKDIVRIHRSWAVNINFIEKIASSKVIIHSEEIPISNSYRQDLEGILDIL